MKRIDCLFMAVTLLLGLTACESSEKKDLTSDINPQQVQGKKTDESFERIYADFAVKSFKNFTDKEKNSMISPVSIMLALSMTANGAEGETLEEMKNLLAEGMGTEELNQYLYALSEKLTQGESAMKIANSVWFRDDENRLQVNEDFLQTVADYYNAQIFKEPFNQQTLNDINNWVKKNTDGMIEKILDEIDIDTVMYLINAITFEAQWERIYYDTEIYKGTFYNSDGSEAQREFMYSEENKYISLNGAEGFIKDYKGGNFSFAALLPPENLEIDEFIESLDGEALLNAFKNYEDELVVVNMPKFSGEYETELKEPLIDMGMERAFDSGKAEFEKMCTSTRGNVYINRVVHKTFINVDEKGTTAGAVTMVEANDEGAILGKEVKLDRPFLYFIIDNETGIPLFMGKILNLT